MPIMAETCDWQLRCTELKHRGSHLLQSGQWSDCSFLVGSEPHQVVVPGHKLILAMASPVFEAMFYGGMAERNEPIPILDVQPEAFKALLEYIYTDNINISSFDKACELCYGAKKYMLPHLVKECTRYLWSDLYPKNACRAYEFARLFEESVLMDKCLQIISTNTKEVLTDSSFEEVELSTVITVFSLEHLNVDSELDLFEAAARYARAQARRQPSPGPANKLSIRHAIEKIRFLTLTPQQFAEGPARSSLLTESEAFAVLMNILSSSSDVPLPVGFSSCRVPRKQLIGSGPSNNMPTFTVDTPSPVMVEHPERPLAALPYPRPRHDVPGVRLSSSIHTLSALGPEHLERHSNDFNKIYCQRPIIQHTDCLNTSVLDCSVTFMVDKNICLLGVQVPTQAPSEESAVSALGGTGYSELLYAHLLDADGARLTYTHYTNRVPYRHLLDIMFNRPVYIQRNKVYKVGIVFNKVGWYPMGSCAQQVAAESVFFNFGIGQSSDSVRDGLIRSIIFTY
ncbi:kelch-like protein 26 [Cydia fagiglandana]|uniref:kelch-like protein 26 n=1 Tax=Cydia fagiglandana TaxID=1458189 RepID=UPI002FEE1178